MPWYAQQGPAGISANLKKAAASPGKGWVEIPGATDAMTQAQAAAQLEQDILHGDFGESIGNGLNAAASGLGNLASGLGLSVPGLSSIGDFFKRLAQGATWTRLAEGLLGIVLIAVGLARITRAVPIATHIAEAVA